MKNAFKKQIKELTRRIDFPMAVYLYETGRIIAINKRAGHLAGENITNINRIWEGKGKQKFSDSLLNNGCMILYQRYINNKKDRIVVDIEVSSVNLGQEHLIILLLEQSYKKPFHRSGRRRVPRILWRNKKLELTGCNTILENDLERKYIEEKFLLKNGDDNELLELRRTQKEFIRTQESQFDLLEEVMLEEDSMSFAKVNRIVMTNKNGTSVGMLTIYTLMIENEATQLFMDDLQRENNILTEALQNTGQIAVTWEKGKEGVVNYISPNVEMWGYTPLDFYEKGMTWKDLVVKEDYPVFQKKNTAAESMKNQIFTVMYRIRKKNGEVIRIKDETMESTINDDTKYKQGVLSQCPDDNKDNIRFLLNRGFCISPDASEFVMYYQPIMGEDAKECIGAEALLRLNDSHNREIGAMEIISLSEYMGMMESTGNFIFQDAFMMCREWNENRDKNFRVHINLSVMQLTSPGILDQITRIARKTKVNPTNIVFEIKESLALEDMKLLKAVLSELKKKKFSILLDDFGTGMSALNTITELPLDYIKLDETFIRDYGTSKFKPGLLVAIVDLAHTLKMKVIVSGIETKKQMDFLFLSDIDGYQGYYIEYPLPKEQFVRKEIIKQ